MCFFKQSQNLLTFFFKASGVDMEVIVQVCNGPVCTKTGKENPKKKKKQISK